MDLPDVIILWNCMWSMTLRILTEIALVIEMVLLSRAELGAGTNELARIHWKVQGPPP